MIARRQLRPPSRFLELLVGVVAAAIALSCTRPERRLEKSFELSSESAVELSPRGMTSLRDLLHLYAREKGLTQPELKIFLAKFLPPMAERLDDFFDDAFLRRERVSAEEVLSSLRKNNSVIRFASRAPIHDFESLMVGVRTELELAGCEDDARASAPRLAELERLARGTFEHFRARDPDFLKIALGIGKILANIEREIDDGSGPERSRLLERIVWKIHLLGAERAELTSERDLLDVARARLKASWYAFAFQFYLLRESQKDGATARALGIAGLQERLEVVQDPDSPGKDLVIDRGELRRGIEANTWDPLDATDFLNLRGARVMHRWLFDSLPQAEENDVESRRALEELSWWTAIRYLYRLNGQSAEHRNAMIASAFPAVTAKLGAAKTKTSCCLESPELTADFGAEWVSMAEFDALTALCGPSAAELVDRDALIERVAAFNKKIADEKTSRHEALCGAWSSL